ncbi:Threonine/homoserine/homoserine lactone efflux protein [Arthrobacter alpinus]|uniref:Threonine/homoserine/homoserine lactone efflux protein n=1 Tax=Arthrobacter alpinus TaxID=656366 RepID=A0A1H5N0J8_9MICC|nr:LysE family translocator [Arthrobacter alpinus]SEE95122.1 Threonine/homoserine/homoserine lactone efflux protein [Arthrobacter alpinus]
MEPQALTGFLIVAITLTCTPGPDWAFAIAAGLGRRSFVPAVAGLCSGYVLHTVLLAAGIAALMAAIPSLLLWLTVAGAIYLLWLGFVTTKSWRGAGFVTVGPNGEIPTATTAGTVAAPDASRSAWGSFLQGFGTSSINPKGLLLFVALTPQFIKTDAALSVPLQSAILGLSFVLSTAVIYTLVAAGSRKLLRSRPGAARGVTLSSGIIMCGLGAVLLIEQIGPVTAAARQLSALA